MIVGYTLYNMLQIDETIFDNIKLYEKIDKETCICEIEKRCLTLTVNCDFPSLFKSFVEQFFRKNYDIFRELWETKLYEYNPIENYDRTETSEHIISNSGEQKISAMNSSEYQPDSSASSDGSDVFNARVHGNIGVTTSQQMIEAQRELVRYDFYEEVARMFEDELCVSNYGTC